MFWQNLDAEINNAVISKCDSNRDYTLEVYALDESQEKFRWRIVRDCMTILEGTQARAGIMVLQKQCEAAFMEYYAYSDAGKVIVAQLKAAFPSDFWAGFEEDEGELVAYRKRGSLSRLALGKLTIHFPTFEAVVSEYNGGIFASFSLTFDRP